MIVNLRCVKLEVLFISYPGNQFKIQMKLSPAVILCLSFEEDAAWFQMHCITISNNVTLYVNEKYGEMHWFLV